MRLAGGKGIHDDLSHHFDGLDSSEDTEDGELSTFMELYELLRSKGYSENMAENVAERMATNQEPKAKKTTRFALIYDDPSKDDREGRFDY
tara:strand:+ start:2688 stop:2960 length:273 start_codon:yes stop_codon:yes gene_type:complete